MTQNNLLPVETPQAAEIDASVVAELPEVRNLDD